MKKLIATLALSSMLITPALARTTCSSFSTQAQAQKWYDQRKASGQNGWKSLDRDKDGEPCECLKGGSHYGDSVCKR